MSEGGAGETSGGRARRRPTERGTMIGGSAGDAAIGMRNRERWETKRGRVCGFPGCKETVRYTKAEQRCGKHEGEKTIKPLSHRRRKALPLPGLRRARTRLKMSRPELAEIARISPHTIALYERQNVWARKERAKALAAALGTTVAELAAEPAQKGEAA